MNPTISVGGTALPSPVSVTVNDEIIWSADTGRTLTGLMSGSVVAEKKNISVKWGMLAESEFKLIKSKLKPGFIPITFKDCDGTSTITAYRGTLSGEQAGYFGGTFYYKSATVDIIQR